MVRAPPDWVIPVLTLGALGLILWPGRMRLAGLAPMALALAGWALAPRPALLIDRDGALVGLMTPQGRALSRARGAGYAAEGWLEADGDGADQTVAAARAGFLPVAGGVRFGFDGQDWLHLTGARGLEALAGHCRDGVTIVIDRAVPAPPPGCRILDPPALADSGAWGLEPGGPVQTAAERAGARPWTR
jgi:competence protein ComEC